MMLLIGLASQQERQQTVWPAKLLEVIYLLLIVLINKGFYCSNRSINGLPAKQRRQSASHPSCQAPRPQQPASLFGWQPILDLLQVIGFGDAMRLSKCEHLLIPAPSGNSHNAFVNVDSARLTCMI